MADWPTTGQDPWGDDLKAYIDDADSEFPAGTELGYAERVSNYTTTQTSFLVPIDALQVEVTGAGRAVDVEFYAANVYHSVANTLVNALLVVDGVAGDANGQLGSESSPSTTAGPALYFKKRIVLDDGVDYQFNVMFWGAAAGTSTIVAVPFAPTFLSVVSR